ncbi:MAG: EVE domain-containing protein [Opitutales bacterium]|jgi:predicted RNA-binding protein with PUA-like domain|nr:EVE domain-containing protein [Opitutales bacterium]MDP4644556.1 EVE domain-containing protein [Opitutales bacterium]MDP4694342.1 EVE domain-containing protein [Opitutales bacterium]MDP4777355.1 EVE domain-containing protein [Opitutales bacterium]MDP4883900.1 EVE domain-containing protein [Opitutales bacterium]
MNYWLMKSEPDVFSFEDLKNRPKQTEPWDGVRNYQARNFMRDEMKVGDLILFYHSNTNPPGVAGIAEVASAPYPDPTAFDKKSKYFDLKSDPKNPRWMLIDVKYNADLKRSVSLEEMKSMPALEAMRVLQRGNRLSITPVTKKEFFAIRKAGN